MKKTVAFILMLITVFYSFSFFAFADESAIGDKTALNDSNKDLTQNILDKDILSFSCHYLSDTKTVNVKGTMNYDAFAEHGDSTLVIYAIPSGKSESDVINDENAKPIAEAPVSITFAFAFKVSSIVDRYSRYAIFLRSENGEYILATEAQYPEAASEIVFTNDKSAFKGLVGNYSSNISNVNSDITILPVYLDDMITAESSALIYTVDGKQIFFNESYIKELDSQIRSLSPFGTKVYLRFLLRSGEIIESYSSNNSVYALPNVFDEEIIFSLHSITDFLVKRYSGGLNGEISGIVLGKSWDQPAKYNYLSNVSFEDYLLLCGQYTAIVYNAAHDVNPKLDIMLSISGNGFYIDETDGVDLTKQLSSKKLLEALMQYFDDSSYSGIKCKLLVEADKTPLMITSDDIKNGIDVEKILPDDKFYIGNQDAVSEFLRGLSQKYESASEYYGLLWTPDPELSGNALCAAYSYAFYASLVNNSVTSFSVEFSSIAGNENNLTDLLHILKHIDAKNNDVTRNTLAFFNKDSWSEVLGLDTIPSPTNKELYSSEILNNSPKKIKGKFDYFDFNTSYLAENWGVGSGCDNLKIGYSHANKKALRADFFVSNKDFCDVIYHYEYPENISYTPYIQFDLELTDNSSSVYEIKFTFESTNSTHEAKSLIRANEKTDLILDMSKSKGFESLKTVKISVRSLNDDSDSCTLWINKITGLSKKYTSSKLSALIKSERDKQMQKNDAENTRDIWMRYITIAAIVAVSAILGVALMLMLQKNNRVENRKK